MRQILRRAKQRWQRKEFGSEDVIYLSERTMNILTKEEIQRIVALYQNFIDNEANLCRKETLIEYKKEFEIALLQKWAIELQKG